MSKEPKRSALSRVLPVLAQRSERLYFLNRLFVANAAKVSGESTLLDAARTVNVSYQAWTKECNVIKKLRPEQQFVQSESAYQ
ncbi:hypothetical protein [uncultured Roseobacter sp.]|uniref:hypothetical protein n=1 Tax=uncultured Roseobacter sp. TaxID=114847 RepID=UPI0026312D7B|nr:hypothetical protein [uncultured Roseobacter sp.]